MSTPTRTPATGLGTAQAVWLVAEREIGSKLRSKAFVISTALLFLGALALVIWGGLQAANNSGTPVAVTADAQQYVASAQGLDPLVEVADRGERCRAVLTMPAAAREVVDDRDLVPTSRKPHRGRPAEVAVAPENKDAHKSRQGT